MGRVLALDIGERRIGVAVSDEIGVLAQPLMVIQRQGVAQDIAHILQLVRERGVETVVVGLPVTLRGGQAQAAEKVEEFVSCLREALGTPIVLVDERLSTAEADRRMREADVRRGKRRRSVDAVAAALILERYLGRQRAGLDGEAKHAP
ncbi:MAG: Holliday junction resolvase RuvX [Armatimonadota bacterium]|nr:Holliday junction resolvase RuvX [bacterium]MDW8320413.1 Holliday junction resolvase RuvX [Armatimonadota bacterium]